MVRVHLLLLASAVLLSGCVPLQMLDPNGGTETPMVPSGSFGGAGPPARVQQVKTSFAPGSTDSAVQVDVVRRKVLIANPEVGVKPLTGLIGEPRAEVFHQGTQSIWVTEGLVKRCKSEGE